MGSFLILHHCSIFTLMNTYQDIVTSIPQRFRPEKAGGFTGTFHFDIIGHDSFPFTVSISNNQCSLNNGLQGNPDCIVRTKTETYVKLELGAINPQVALMMGKVKVSNLSAMMAFSKMFRKYDPSRTQVTELSPALHRKPESGPLVGIKVLDFTRLLPGPMSTMLMADMGAEVIKIEDPDAPDYIRDFPPFINEMAAYYQAVNRSKRSLAINYNTDAGKSIIYHLVKTADVVMEQFRPGVMKSLGLDYETLAAINPKLIYVSITGYGQTGPYANQAGHDLNYIALSGLLGVTGNENGPVISGGQIADIAGGSYMALNACLAALLARGNTGKGQYVDVSMLDATMPLSTFAFSEYAATGQASLAGNHQLSGGLVNYNVYVCADGRHVALGALEPKFWKAFCQAVDKPQWADRILDEGRNLQALKDEVSTLFKTEPSAYWQALSEKYDFCLSPVLLQEELAANPQIKARNMVVDSPEGYQQIGVPLKFMGTPAKIHWNAPHLGADTVGILKEAGIADDRIRELIAQHVIKTKMTPAE